MECEFKGCTRKSHCMGLCITHYKMSLYGNELKPIRKKLKENEIEYCIIIGCEKDNHASGFCKSHYEMVRKAVKESKNHEKEDGGEGT